MEYDCRVMRTDARRLPLPDQPFAVQLAATLKPKGDSVFDELTDTHAVEEWLGAIGVQLDDRRLSPEQAQNVRRLRSAIRRVFAQATSDTRPHTADDLDLPAAIETINEAAAGSPARKLVATAGELSTDNGRPLRTVEAAMASFASDAIDIAGGSDRDKIRACYAPNCLHFFLARNAGREWCSPTCGNRVRAARHYSKTRGSSDR